MPHTAPGPEEILLDVNQLAAGKKFLSVRPVGASDDGRLYAYLSDVTGFREYYLSVKDLRTGRVLEDNFVKVSDVEWAGDNRTLFYVIEDAAKRPYKLFRHVVGQPKRRTRSSTRKKTGGTTWPSAARTTKNSSSKPPPVRRRPSSMSSTAIRPRASFGSSRRGPRELNTRSSTATGCFTSARTRTGRSTSSG